MNRRQKGSFYEAAASDYLKSLGYTIIDMNYRCRLGEIDIVALSGDTLSFIEVKYRSSADFGYPSEAVGLRKQKKIIRTSEYYCLANGIDTAITDISYDIVEMLGDRVRLIKNAFWR